MIPLTFRSDFTVDLMDHMGDDTSLLAAMMVSTKGAQAEQFRHLYDEDGALDLDWAERVDPKTVQEVRGKIEFLMRNRHGTPFEHASLTFLVEAPIAVFREWHRHRIGVSINEESGRYKQLEPVFYVPPRHRPLVQQGKPGHYVFVPGAPDQYDEMAHVVKTSCESSYGGYERLLSKGIAKEVARGVLPVYIYSSMYWTCNPRSLMAFLSLRTTVPGYAEAIGPNNSSGAPDVIPEALFPSFPMWEIEQCALQMEAHFASRFPITHSAFRKFGSVAP